MPAQPLVNVGKKPSLNGENNKTLADILVVQGALDSVRAKQVNLAEIQSGKTQEEILTGQNLVKEKDLARAKAELYNIPFIDLTSTPSSPEALATLPQEVAARFSAFPVSVDPVKHELVVAMADPLDLTAIEFIEQKTSLSVKPHAGEKSVIEHLISTAYSSSLAREVTAALKEVTPTDKVKTLDIAKTGVIREEKVAEIVSHILSFAVKSRASDVHIEPQGRSTRVRYRIDGILQEKLTTPAELHDALVSRIKILSGMKIDEKRIPQDGRFNFKTENQEVDLRVSSLPTSWGEKIVMRLLKKSGGIPELVDLGLRGRALKNLQDAILRPHGIILICGPTGSGKTTTLYSIIQQINTPQINIITLEDPIEYKMPGVNQVQVNNTAGLTFASGLRSFLRQDPNVILVGEIRDEETADLAIQASLTGHLVFSTLHTNDASGALPRLLDMKAEPYLLASSITALVAQRVVRKIHEDCKTEYEPEAAVVEDMKNALGSLWPAATRGSSSVLKEPSKSVKQDSKSTNNTGNNSTKTKKTSENNKVKLYKGKGDRDCNDTGYYGRMGIFEVLPISEKISRLILERSPANEIDKLAKSDGMISMKQDGYLKALEGITSIEEVLRVAQE